MKLLEFNGSLFAVTKKGVYKWSGDHFCEVEFKDCNGQIVAQIGGVDDDPKDGNG